MMDFNDHITQCDKNNRYKYACKTCGHTFPDQPVSPQSYNYVTRQAIPKDEYDILFREYKNKEYEWERQVADHLLTHPLAECEYCHSVVKKATLKAHHKSYGCSVQRRRYIMEEKGYKEVHNEYKLLMQCANLLHRRMLHATSYSHDTFDNEELRDSLSEELDKAKRLFRQLAGIRLAYTAYNKLNPAIDPDDPSQGWQLRAWAPNETVVAIKEVLKKWTKLPYNEQTTKNAHIKMEAYTRMWEWLMSDEESRFAAIGLWELADSPP